MMSKLGVLNRFDPWKNKLCTCPPKYTINPYTGCSHQCLYCYATSYIKLRRSIPKKDLLGRLIRDLRRINPNFPIDMSLSSDPYPPEEKQFRLTRRVLKVLLPLGLRVQITTKSDIFVDDIDLIAKYNVALSLTITTLDSTLAKKIEPFAPLPRDRLHALRILNRYGVPFSIRVDPIIPFLNDDAEELAELVETVVSLGAKHIVTSTYKARLDNFARMTKAFPEIAPRWEKLYYPKGKKFSYAYLPLNLRKTFLSRVVSVAKRLGITYATCREGLTTGEFFSAPSCDGTHLIPSRIPLMIKRGMNLRLPDLFES